MDNNKYQLNKQNYLDLKKKTHLELFAKMSFEGYNKRDWDIVRKIIDPNVVTLFSNGMEVTGVEPTIDMLMKHSITWAPDSKITDHRIAFGSGDWTCVNLIIQGTFTEPMDSWNGKFIQPTNKKYTMNNCALAKWKNNTIIKFFIFGDSLSFMKQIGVQEEQTGGSIDYMLMIQDDGEGNKEVKQNLWGLQQINFAGYNKRNWDLILKYFDENLVTELPDGSYIRGSKENMEFMKDNLRWSPDSHIESHRIQFGDGPWTCANIIGKGTVKETGKPYTMNHCSIGYWKNNKLFKSFAFTDTGDLVKQIGYAFINTKNQ